jgi:NAD(P)-dependent dehydrogenase (short-subunit alcohol dehydrogenase family)
MLLEGKVVIVSGVGAGLGQELAFAAAREGAHVVLAARTRSFLEQVAAGIRDRHGPTARTLVVPSDVSDREQCAQLAEAAVGEFGRVDALINSAYTPGKFGLFEGCDLDDWRRTLDVNLFGALQLSQQVVPQMKRQGGGSIVMVNSMIQKKPLPLQGGYATSKGALATAARMLAKELGPFGIRVNTVFMGWMWGPPVQGYVKAAARGRGVPEQAVIDEIAAQIPLGAIPDDADCANAVLFFASDLSRVITGAGLDVNGGEFMG